MEWLIGIAIVAGAIWLFRKYFTGETHLSTASVGQRRPAPRARKSRANPESLLAEVDRRMDGLLRCRDEAERLKSTARDPSRALAEVKRIDQRAADHANAAFAKLNLYLETEYPDTAQARALANTIQMNVAETERILVAIRDASETAERDGWRPTVEEPWRGRQHNLVSDPDDRPNSAASWEEVYNRPITDQLHFEIEYADEDGVVTERVITPKSIHLVRHEPWVYIRAACSLRGSERTFKSDRIQRCRNLQTNRPLKDLGQYLRGRY